MESQLKYNDYGEYIKLMYQQGFYANRYSIGLMSYEVSCDYNKIIIIPISAIDEDTIYVFTGTLQKAKILSESTEYKLYLEDEQYKEFKDNDLIMMSVVKINEREKTIKINDLFTRNYATWKFGIKFDNNIFLDSEKYLMFQTQKEIGRFDIDIANIDLFRHKNSRTKDDIMAWLD